MLLAETILAQPVPLTGGTGDGFGGIAQGANACFDVDACLTGEGGVGGDSLAGNGADAGANFGGFANGAPGGMLETAAMVLA